MRIRGSTPVDKEAPANESPTGYPVWVSWIAVGGLI